MVGPRHRALLRPPMVFRHWLHSDCSRTLVCGSVEGLRVAECSLARVSCGCWQLHDWNRVQLLTYQLAFCEAENTGSGGGALTKERKGFLGTISTRDPASPLVVCVGIFLSKIKITMNIVSTYCKLQQHKLNWILSAITVNCSNTNYNEYCQHLLWTAATQIKLRCPIIFYVPFRKKSSCSPLIGSWYRNRTVRLAMTFALFFVIKTLSRKTYRGHERETDVVPTALRFL